MKSIFFTFLMIAISTSVFAQWSANPMENTLISGVSGEAVLPKVATHFSGFTYVGYFVNETGNYDVRLQKLDVFGNKLWGDAGLLVSNNTSMSWLTDWDITVDSDTCAILVFQDIRNGNNNIYAYRVSPSGAMLWGDNGVALGINPDFNVTPVVEITEAGSYIFAWVRDATTQTIGMQKLNLAGERQWGETGLQLMGTEDYTCPLLCPSTGDDILLVFSKQTGPFWAPDRSMYVRKLDGSGNPVWANDVLFADAGFIAGYTIPAIASDHNGGVFISWHDERNATQVQVTYAQHVGANGGVFWEPNGVLVCTTPNQWHLDANIAYSTALDELYVFWTDRDFNQSLRGLSGQRLSVGGERLWGDSGKTIIPLQNGDYGGIFANAFGEDIAVFFLGQNPTGTMNSGVYGYKYDKDGNSLWPGNQVALSEVESEKLHMDAGITNSGQVILAWEDRRDDSGDIFGQNIKSDGTLGPVVTSLEVLPSELVYEEIEQCLDGLIFTVSNNSPMSLSISGMELEGMLQNGSAIWIIYPAPQSFPINIEPGDSVQFNVIIGLPTVQSPLGYVSDTLSLWSGNTEYQVIITVNEDLLTSVESKSSEQFSFFPNPAKSFINITTPSDQTGISRLSIIDLNGRIVKETGFLDGGATSIALTNVKGSPLLPGAYYLVVENNGERIFKKLIIK